MFKKIANRIKTRGLISVIENQFNSIVPPWFFRFSIGDVFELGSNQLCQLHEDSSSNGLSFSVVTGSEDRSRLREKTYNSVPVETIENDFGFAIANSESPEDFQGGVWGGVESFIESNLGFRIMLDSDQAWIYCAFVNDSLRGRGCYQKLLAFAVFHLSQQGYQRFYVVVQPWNKASIHIHRKFSVRRVGRIAVVRLFRLACIYRTGALIQDRTWTLQPETNPVHFKLP